jgi:16S rRNA (cytosine967-C5)-methyltransferase
VNLQKPREFAWRVLQDRESSAVYTENLLERLARHVSLSPPDRRLAQELVYGIVRWQGTLDHLIAAKTTKHAPKPGLQNLLRLGLYQLFWLDRIPPHAAVHETVELSRAAGFAKQAGFINAVLRTFLREKEATEQLLNQWQRSSPSLGFSHPDWLVQRWQAQWGGEKTMALLRLNNSPPQMFARINTLRADPGKLLEQWRLQENVEYDFFTSDWTAHAEIFRIKTSPPPHAWQTFQEGQFYIQDPSTLLAVRLLDPQPEETILDLCAAPGGKTTLMAQRMQNTGRIYGHDIAPDRVRLIEENCARLGVSNVQAGVFSRLKGHFPEHAQRPSPAPEFEEDQGAGRSMKPAASKAIEMLPGQMDRVLVDAPCSNTGVLRRRVDLRWRLRQEELERLSLEQLKLLQDGAEFLKPGGVLVYSTCSLEPEENEKVVETFLQTAPRFRLESKRLLTPFEHQVDGAFVARLVKTN